MDFLGPRLPRNRIHQGIDLLPLARNRLHPRVPKDGGVAVLLSVQIAPIAPIVLNVPTVQGGTFADPEMAVVAKVEAKEKIEVLRGVPEVPSLARRASPFLAVQVEILAEGLAVVQTVVTEIEALIVAPVSDQTEDLRGVLAQFLETTRVQILPQTPSMQLIVPFVRIWQTMKCDT